MIGKKLTGKHGSDVDLDLVDQLAGPPQDHLPRQRATASFKAGGATGIACFLGAASAHKPGDH